MKLHYSLQIPLEELIGKTIINTHNKPYVIDNFVLDIEATRVRVVIRDDDADSVMTGRLILDLESLEDWSLVYENF